MLIEIAVLLFLFLLIFFGLLQQPGRNLDLDFRGKKLKKHENAQQNFVHGFQELNKAVLILNNAEIDETTTAKAVTAIAQTMSSPLRLAYRHFTAALKVWEEENARQNEEVEKLVCKVGKLKSIVSENNANMRKLKVHLSSLNCQIEDNQRQLWSASDSLSRAENALEESKKQLREKKEQQGIVAVIGIVATVTVFPLIAGIGGLLGGTAITVISVAVYEEAVKEAQRTVTSARDNVNSFTNMLNKERKNKVDLKRELSRKVSENEEAEERLKLLKEELEPLQKTQKKDIELSEKLKRTCHILQIVWGKSKVLNDEAQRAYILEPFLTPLREMFTMWTPEEQRKKTESTFLLSNYINVHDSISSKLETIYSEADNSEI
jgi:predicted RNase H-like nuclease (RuvC/YqgF family)